MDQLESIEPGVVDAILLKLSGRDLVSLSLVSKPYLRVVQGLPNSTRRARYEEALNSLKHPLQNPTLFQPVRLRAGDKFYEFKTVEEFRELFVRECVINPPESDSSDDVLDSDSGSTGWPVGWEPRQMVSLSAPRREEPVLEAVQRTPVHHYSEEAPEWPVGWERAR